MAAKVFISSIMSELHNERRAVQQALVKAGIEVIWFEGFRPGPGDPRSSYMQGVHDCDVFLGIYWNEYGLCSETGISAIEEEYCEGSRLRRPCLLYIKDFRPKRHERLVDFLERVSKDHTYKTFTFADELAQRVVPDVVNCLPPLPKESTFVPEEYLRHLRAFIENGFDCPSHSGVRIPVARIPVRVIPARGALSSEALQSLTAGELAAEMGRRRGPRLVTGPAGSGKSVFLRQLALSLIDAGSLPVLVNLKNFDTQESFYDFLRRYLLEGPPSARALVQHPPSFTSSLASSLQSFLQAGKVCLLLDGVDEMPQADYADRLDRLYRFIGSFPANCFVLTIRHILEQPNFHYQELTVQALDDGAARELIAWHWSGSASGLVPGELEPLRIREDRPDLDHLCANPLLLEMLIAYFQDRRVVPEHVGRIYEPFLERLLKGHASSVELGRLKEVLSAIALRISDAPESGSRVALSGLQQAGIITSAGDEALRVGRESGILVVDDKDQRVSFGHQKIQDYFAVLALDRQCERDTIPGVLSRLLERDHLRVGDLLGALIAVSERGGEIVDHLLRLAGRGRHSLTAAEAIVQSGRSLTPTRWETVFRLLLTLLDHPAPGVRVRVLHGLSRIAVDVPSTAELLRAQQLRDSSLWVEETCHLLLFQLRARHPEAGVKLLSRWQRLIASLKRTDAWRPLWTLLATLAGFAVMAWAISHPLPASFGLRVAVIVFGASYIFALYWTLSVIYELRLRGPGAPPLAVGAKAVVLVLTALAVTTLGLIAVRPSGFLFVAASSGISVWTARTLVLTPGKRRGIVAKTLLQFIAPFLFGCMYLACGFLPQMEWTVQPLLAHACALGLGLLSALRLIDWIAIRALGRKVTGSRDRRSVTWLKAIVLKGLDSGIGFLDAQVNWIRCQAIPILGRLGPLGRSVLQVVAVLDDSPIIRDTAAQALGTEDVIVRDSAKTGRERFHLLVQGSILVLLGVISAATLSRFGLIHDTWGAAKAFALFRVGSEQKALHLYAERVHAGGATVGLLNEYAFALSTARSPANRNCTEAIIVANRAVEMDQGQTWMYLDTLAEAYACAGRRAEALAAIERAMEKDSNPYLRYQRERFRGVLSQNSK